MPVAGWPQHPACSEIAQVDVPRQEELNQILTGERDVRLCKRHFDGVQYQRPSRTSGDC
jgi:hypothetical protein